jgi:hypothetical protein
MIKFANLLKIQFDVSGIQPCILPLHTPAKLTKTLVKKKLSRKSKLSEIDKVPDKLTKKRGKNLYNKGEFLSVSK